MRKKIIGFFFLNKKLKNLAKSWWKIWGRRKEVYCKHCFFCLVLPCKNLHHNLKHTNFFQVTSDINDKERQISVLKERITDLEQRYDEWLVLETCSFWSFAKLNLLIVGHDFNNGIVYWNMTVTFKCHWNWSW